MSARKPDNQAIALQFRPMRNRIRTFEVRSNLGAKVGYVRLAGAGQLVARTLGDAFNAADIRIFTSVEVATHWLLSEHSGMRKAA